MGESQVDVLVLIKRQKRPSATSLALHSDPALTSSTASPQEGTSATANSEGSSPSSQSDQFPFLSRFIHRSEEKQADLWARDLELIHHWTVEAHYGLSQRKDICHAWQREAPQQAVVHTYLMHEILAFTAFHKAYKNIEQRPYYYACGIHHQDAAIRGIRQMLHNVTPYEAPAIFATSTLLTLSVFASTGFEARFPETAESTSAIDDILNIFHLMQGMGSMLSIARQHVLNSFIAPMIRRSSEPIPAQPLLQTLEQQLPVLVAFIESKCDLAEPERVAYLESIACFRLAFELASGETTDNRELRFLFGWPLNLKPAYLSYLRERRPGALAVLSHYVTFFLIAEPKHWYVEGWGDRLMRACRDNVDPSWMPAIQWAMSFPDHTTLHNSSDPWFHPKQASPDEVDLSEMQRLSMSISHSEQSHSRLPLPETCPSTLQTG